MIYILLTLFYGFNLCAANAKGQKENIPDSLLIPAVWHVLEDYYSYYYQYPDSTNQVSEFVEEMLQTNKDKSIHFLDPYSFNNYFLVQTYLDRGVSIYKSQEYMNVTYNEQVEKIPIEHIGFQVCEIDLFIGDSPNGYEAFLSKFLKARFYDLQGKAIIITRELNSELKELQYSLRRKYLLLGTFGFRKYQYEDIEVPIRVVMMYNVKKGLKYYCSSKDIDNKLLYYKALESSLEEFCSKKDLSQMYFLSPDYYSILP